MHSSIFLKTLHWDSPPEGAQDRYPWSLKALCGLKTLPVGQPVTFFAGDNGSGKSTVLEAIAVGAGFNREGGSRNQSFATTTPDALFGDRLHLIWNRKISHGFFFRAESFFEFSSQLDEMARDPWSSADEVYAPYGGRSLHTRSHGESFLTLFTTRLRPFGPSLYLFDEPESALSPIGQMAFLRLLEQWRQSGLVQVIIASHSPILLSYPDAVLYDFDRHPLRTAPLSETTAYSVYRQFLENPAGTMHALFAPDKDEAPPSPRPESDPDSHGH